jgi:hypothetical protein
VRNLRRFHFATGIILVVGLVRVGAAGAEPAPGHPSDCSPSQAAEAVAAADEPGASLAARIDSVLPTEKEDRFLSVPWRTNLMAARREAEEQGRPIFLWIMVGNPQGCT